jgi:hypothetical protein
MMGDPLAEFYTIPITVRRFTGRGSFGPTYAAATTEHGRVRYGAKLIRNSDGEQVVSQARITLPLATARIPVDSLVIVDATSALERRVIAEERHDTGMADMPNHYTIDLD